MFLSHFEILFLPFLFLTFDITKRSMYCNVRVRVVSRSLSKRVIVQDRLFVSFFFFEKKKKKTVRCLIKFKMNDIFPVMIKMMAHRRTYSCLFVGVYEKYTTYLIFSSFDFSFIILYILRCIVSTRTIHVISQSQNGTNHVRRVQLIMESTRTSRIFRVTNRNRSRSTSSIRYSENRITTYKSKTKSEHDGNDEDLTRTVRVVVFSSIPRW